MGSRHMGEFLTISENNRERLVRHVVGDHVEVVTRSQVECDDRIRFGTHHVQYVVKSNEAIRMRELLTVIRVGEL